MSNPIGLPAGSQQAGAEIVTNSHASVLCKIQVRPTDNADEDAWLESHFDAMPSQEAEQWCADATRTDSQFDYRAVPIHVLVVEDQGLQVVRAALAAYVEQLGVWCSQALATEHHVADLLVARKVLADSWLI